MRMALRIVCLLTAFAIGGALPAEAHTRSESHSAWQIDGTIVHLQFTVPDLEAKRITKNGSMPSKDELGQYVAKHVGVFTGDKTCPVTSGPAAISTEPGYQRYEFEFQCPNADDIKVHSSAFFELVRSHTDFAQIETDKGQFVEQLITLDHQTIDVSNSAQSPLENAGFLTFVGMGLMHIFTGVDHMSFMLGLVLISRRLRDLLFVVTGFTVGHSISLALAVTGIFRPEPQYINALVALTIALIGAENLGDATHRPLPFALGLGGLMFVMAFFKSVGMNVTLPTLLLIGGGIFSANYLMLTGHLRDAGRVRLVVTLAFGLIHGFGFASNLLEMRLPKGRLAELLFGFNSGVEVGQLTVVLTALLVAYALSKVRLAMPRPIFTDLAATFLVGEGLYWFLGRSVA